MKTTTVKTEVEFVTRLLSDVRSGKLRVPKFQRPFVWNHEKVRRLLDSILKGYPIGSIFVWDTSERFENFDRVGPIRVAIDQPPQPTPVGYLLDGHQRLSTLIGVLTASEAELEASEANGVFRVYFNLQRQEFEHTRRPEIWHFPVRCLIDTNDFIDECERIRREAKDSAVEWIQRAKHLVTIFQNCQVGVTRVFHAEMSEAIEAFTRLNTEGVRMTPEQIFFALSYQEGDLDVAAEVDRIVEDVLASRNYGDISRTALLRVLLAAMEKDIYGAAANWRDIVKNERDTLKAAIGAVRESLEPALDLLAEVGASSQKALPYALQLVMLSEYFRIAKGQPSDQHLEALKRWFWVSSFTGAYMVGSSTRFNAAVDAARGLARGKDVTTDLELDVPALPLPERFHQRAARVRAFFLFLKSLGPIDPTSHEPSHGVLDAGLGDARPIFKNADGAMLLGNRALLGKGFSGDPVTAFRKLADCGADERERILKSHGISEVAWAALLRGDDGQFAATRRLDLVALETEFMKKCQVTPPRTSGAGGHLALTLDPVDDSDT